jgi:hypothetical protein
MTKWRGCVILAAFAAWLVALPAVAAERVVVLELGNPAGLQDQETQYLSDLLRGAVSETTGARYFVLTRENLLELLPPGTSLAACVGTCEVETGRKVGADHVVSGEVVRFGDQLRASLRLHETRSGRLEGMETASAAGLAGLEQPLKDAGRRLTERLPGVEVASAPAPGVAAPGDALLVAGFGADMAVPEAPAEPEPLQPPVPVTTDVALLEKLQAVRRAEAESPRTAATCATTWRALADHPKDHPLRATATQRAEAWETTAHLAKARFLALAEVREKFQTDTDTLRRYLALDRDIVSRRQKAAFIDEFRTAWTWYRPYQAMPPEVETAPAAARPVFPGGGLVPASPPSNVSVTPRPMLLGPSQSDPPILLVDDTYWPPIVLMILGVSGVGLGLLTTVVGNFQSNDFDLKNCRRWEDDRFATKYCTDSEWEVARDEATAGDDTIDAGWTIVGLGGAATVAGGLWFLVHAGMESKPKKSSGRGVGAVFGPDGLTVYGRF